MEPNHEETANNHFPTNRSVFFCSQYEVFTWDLENTTFPWIIVGSIILLSPITILMNLLVIVTVVKRRDLQKLSNILLRSLALVDLLVGAVSMPLSATVDVLILRQIPVEHICDLDLANISVIYFLSVLSLYHLTVIAWERNLAIRKGLQYQVFVSKSLLIKLSIFVWLLTVFTDLPATILAFRLTETLVQLNSLLTPLIYWYRDRRFRNAVLEILRLREPQPIHPPVAARIACRSNPVGTLTEQLAWHNWRTFSSLGLDSGNLFIVDSKGFTVLWPSGSIWNSEKNCSRPPCKNVKKQNGCDP